MYTLSVRASDLVNTKETFMFICFLEPNTRVQMSFDKDAEGIHTLIGKAIAYFHMVYENNIVM